MQLTDTCKAWLVETATALKGYERRRFMARTVQELGPGGQRRAERELGWNRQTIRKAIREVEHGLRCIDAVAFRRRKRAEERLPTLLDDIKALVDGQSQTDPSFRTTRLYTRLTAPEVRRQLIAQKGYTDHDLPTTRTISTKLRDLGYHPTKVAKTQPQKRSLRPTRSSTNSPG
jgi:Rhodopirellula transposase DDE domain